MRASTLILPLVASAGASAAALSNAEKVAALRAAPQQTDRVNILSEDQDFVFDFLKANFTNPAGTAVGAAVGNFPALVNNGIAMTVAFLGPCGMNTPHTHPRATEMLYLVNGSITTGMIPENTSRFVFNQLQAGQAQVFLKGSIHYQQNELCDPVMFVAALNNEDPGVESIAQRYFGLPPDVVAASLGDLGVEEVIGIESMIPDNIALGRQECLDRCGIKREGQKTTQRQQRNANNALTSGTSSTWPSTKTKVYSPTSTHYTRSNSQQTGNVFGALADDASSAIASTGISKNVLIALCVVVGAMAIGYVAIGIVWLAGRRRRAAEKANRFYVRPEMTGRSLVPTTEEKYDTPQQ
ncbi:RmlC-like cupin domain-containing protein [Fomes fomentarius]|nr:RmlC-like cupin domain-containing protein [Fomes fomentarius]